MDSDGNAFEILPDRQLEDLTTPAVTTFLETHRRYDDNRWQKCLSPEIEEDPQDPTEDCDCSSRLHSHLQVSRQGQQG